MVRELWPDVEKLRADALAHSQQANAALLVNGGLSSNHREALYRFRAHASNVCAAWPGMNIDPFVRFTLLSVVDCHDAAVEAHAGLISGHGTAAICLLRRFYEATILLAAAWDSPNEFEAKLRVAGARGRRGDNYASWRDAGILGTALPGLEQLKPLLGASKGANQDLEQALASIGHGGFFSQGFYLTDDPTVAPNRDFEGEAAFVEVSERCAALGAAAAQFVLQRNGFELTDEFVDAFFSEAAIEFREDSAMDRFGEEFSGALQVLWCATLGVVSLGHELAELAGNRPPDSLRRWVTVLIDGSNSAMSAIEMLHRGRLSGAATVTRRIFELGLELEAWARDEAWMHRQVQQAIAQGRSTAMSDTTLPGRLISRLHAPNVAEMQVRTYSILCSAAHAGAQAHEYLFSTRLVAPTPAPMFSTRHTAWMVGTLCSALASLLGAGLQLAKKLSDEVYAGHLAYAALIPSWTEEHPELGLITPA